MKSAEWNVQLTRRGGSPVVFDIPWSKINFSPTLNNSMQGTIELAVAENAFGASPCQVIAEAEPWRDEIKLWRGNKPVVEALVYQVNGKARTITFQDLSFWLERRRIDIDMHFIGDTADTFEAIFHQAMAVDTSPNISIQTYTTGVKGIRNVKKKDGRRAADLLKELSRTALDYTTIGRKIFVGGPGVFPSTENIAQPLILHDQGVIDTDPMKDGSLLYTDVAVFAGTTHPDGTTRKHPISGRATSSTEIYGSVQGSFTELLIDDLDSANKNAEARLKAMLPAPRSASVTIGPNAAFEYEDLIPGRLVDSRLKETTYCIDMMQMMRMTGFSVSVDGNGESISLTLVPLGEFASNA